MQRIILTTFLVATTVLAVNAANFQNGINAFSTWKTETYYLDLEPDEPLFRKRDCAIFFPEYSGKECILIGKRYVDLSAAFPESLPNPSKNHFKEISVWSEDFNETVTFVIGQLYPPEGSPMLYGYRQKRADETKATTIEEDMMKMVFLNNFNINAYFRGELRINHEYINILFAQIGRIMVPFQLMENTLVLIINPDSQ